MKTWHFTMRWLLGAQLAARLLGLLNNLLLARLLAPSSFGDFVGAMAFAGALAPLADTGVSAVVTRHVARRPHLPYMLGAALTLRQGQCLLLWGAALAAGWWARSSPHLALATTLAGAYWATACFSQLLAGVARARVQAHLEARAVLLERALTVPLAALGAATFGVVGALAGVLAGGIAGLFYLRRYLALPPRRTSLWAWQRLLAIGVPLAIGDVCHGLIMRLDILAVGMFFGSASAGYYGSASTLLWAGILIPGSMAMALVPAQAQRNSPALLQRRVLTWMLIVGGLIALALSVLAPVWVRLLYGAAYLPAAEVLHVLAWAFLPATVVAWGNAVLIVHHRAAAVAVVAAGGLVCLLLCLWWLLPAYGPLSAALAQLAAQCLMAVGIWWLAVRHASTANE